MTQSSKAYELLTKTVFEELAKLEGWKTLEITHNKILKSPTGAEHQIDVYIKYELLGREQEIVIECKDFQKPVDKPRLMAFVGVVKDLMRVQGLFVTRKGFDKGNIAPIAEAHNIGLYVLDDTDEYSIKFNAELREHVAQVVQLGFAPDYDPEPFDRLTHVVCEDWLIYDKNDILKTSLQKLMDKAMEQLLSRNAPIGEYITLNFNSSNDMFIQDRNGQLEKTRLLSVVFQRQVRTRVREVDFKLTHLLQIITNDKKYYVSQDGKIFRADEEMPIPIVFESAGPNGADILINVITRIRKDEADSL